MPAAHPSGWFRRIEGHLDGLEALFDQGLKNGWRFDRAQTTKDGDQGLPQRRQGASICHVPVQSHCRAARIGPNSANPRRGLHQVF